MRIKKEKKKRNFERVELPVSLKPEVRSYSYYAFPQCIIMAEERIGKRIAKFEICDSSETGDWTSIGLKQEDSCWVYDTEDAYNRACNGCIYRPLAGNEGYIHVKMHFQQESEPWAAINLYEVARTVDTTSGDITVGNICRNISYSAGTGNKVQDSCIKNNLVEAIQFLCSQYRIFKNGKVPTRHQKSLRILGMAVHLTADTFAHKTRVPANVIILNYRDTSNNIMKESDIKSVSNFREKLNIKMPFDYIVHHLQPRGINNDYHNYEDDAGFYSKRFVAAINAVQQVIKAYAEGNSSIQADEVFKKDKATECKVAFLDKYVEKVYNQTRSKKCNDYKFTPADEFKDSYVAGLASLK